MKKTLIYFLISLCLPVLAAAQSISDTASSVANTHLDTTNNLKNLKVIAGQYKAMQVDALENIYLLTADDKIKKLNAAGDSVSVYNDVKTFGHPGTISVANPMQALVYYPAFTTVVILDRFLTEQGRLNFRDHNIFSVSAVASSYDNNIWIFDEQNMQLKKLNANGKVLMASNDVRTFLKQAPRPEMIIDAEQFVYLFDPAIGFFQFDRYGTYVATLSAAGWKNVGAVGNHLFGFDGTTLAVITMPGKKVVKLDLGQKDVTGASAVNGKLYLLTNEGVSISKFQ